MRHIKPLTDVNECLRLIPHFTSFFPPIFGSPFQFLSSTFSLHPFTTRQTTMVRSFTFTVFIAALAASSVYAAPLEARRKGHNNAVCPLLNPHPEPNLADFPYP